MTLPHRYTLGAKARETALAPTYPMYYDHLWEAAAYGNQSKRQFMLGADVLVAPVTTPLSCGTGPTTANKTTPNCSTGTATTSLWLPPGTWLPAFPNSPSLPKERPTDGVVTVLSGLGQVPVYVRRGAVVPMLPYATAVKHGSASRAFDPLTWAVYGPDRSLGGGRGELFEDDGLSVEAAHVNVTLAYHVNSSGCVEFRTQTTGSYFGAPTTRQFSLQVIRPTTACAGDAVARTSHSAVGAAAFDGHGKRLPALSDCSSIARSSARTEGWCTDPSTGDVWIHLRRAAADVSVEATYCAGCPLADDPLHLDRDAPSPPSSHRGSGSTVAVPDTVDIALRKQLFFDTSLLESSNNTRIAVHRPRELPGGPVLIADSDAGSGEQFIWAYNSVVELNGSTIALYYDANTYGKQNGSVPFTSCFDGVCKTFEEARMVSNDPLSATKLRVAISTDSGRSWKKPAVGMVNYKGSTKNNIVWPRRHYKSSIGIGGVFYDTRDGVPTDELYKVPVQDNLGPEGLGVYMLVSGDGFDWRAMSTEHYAWPATDTANVLLWHPLLKKYVQYTRLWQMVPESGPGSRSCDYCIDPEHCGPATFPPVGRTIGRGVADQIEQFHNSTGEAVFGFDDEDSPCVDVYLSAAVIYEGHELIFPAFFQHFPSPPACITINDGIWDTRIAHFSQKTGRFEYIGADREPWLARGPAGPPTCTMNPPAGSPAWDSAMVAAVRGLVVRPKEGVIRMFKWGDIARHGQDTFNHSAVPFRGGISVLELRLDGEP
jgi:hypothetical protein